MVPVLVVISNGVVERVKICKDAEELQAAFTEEAEDYGVTPCDVNFDDGYIELEDATICMTWAEDSNQKALFLQGEELEELRGYLSEIALAEAVRRRSAKLPLCDTNAIELFHRLTDAVSKGTDEILDQFLNFKELAPVDLFEEIKKAKTLLTADLMERCQHMNIDELENFFDEHCIPLFPSFFNKKA